LFVISRFFLFMSSYYTRMCFLVHSRSWPYWNDSLPWVPSSCSQTLCDSVLKFLTYYIVFFLKIFIFLYCSSSDFCPVLHSAQDPGCTCRSQGNRK
jgi:hypothetical protein